MSMQPDCPKCGKQMEVGFIVDKTYGGQSVATWMAGPPVGSFLTGVKVREEDEIDIRTFRCQSCGFLESYANK